MQLHNFFNSSTSYRVRIALALKGLSYEYLPVNLRKQEQRAAGYVALNPSAGVPLLIDGDTQLSQSLAIIDYRTPPIPSRACCPRMRWRGRACWNCRWPSPATSIRQQHAHPALPAGRAGRQ